MRIALFDRLFPKFDSEISTSPDEFILIALDDSPSKEDFIMLKFFALRMMPFVSMLPICNRKELSTKYIKVEW
jgi:hypothetical protein